METHKLFRQRAARPSLVRVLEPANDGPQTFVDAAQLLQWVARDAAEAPERIGELTWPGVAGVEQSVKRRGVPPHARLLEGRKHSQADAEREGPKRGPVALGPTPMSSVLAMKIAVMAEGMEGRATSGDDTKTER